MFAQPVSDTLSCIQLTICRVLDMMTISDEGCYALKFNIYKTAGCSIQKFMNIATRRVIHTDWLEKAARMQSTIRHRNIGVEFSVFPVKRFGEIHEISRAFLKIVFESGRIKRQYVVVRQLIRM